MKISTQNICNLVQAIRSQNQLSNMLRYSPYRNCYYANMICNEIYFIKKINNNNFHKRDLYEDLIVNNNIFEMDVLLNAIKNAQIMKLDDLYIKNIQHNKHYTYKIEDFSLYKEKIIDYLINSSQLFYDVYNDFELPQQKLLYAEIISNQLLNKYTNSLFSTFIAEAIYCNFTRFNQAIINNNFLNIYLLLVNVQNEKNIERIKKTDQLIKENESLLMAYNANIVKFLYENIMFSITKFVNEINISYNTAKKYLHQLVELKILKSVKVGKHNAFIYEDLYNIWKS